MANNAVTGQVSIRLTNLSNAYIQPDTVYIRDRVCPPIPTEIGEDGVRKTLFSWTEWDLSQALELTETLQGTPREGRGSDGVLRVGHEEALREGRTLERKHAADITTNDLAAHGRAVAERIATRKVTIFRNVNMEARVANLFNNTASYPDANSYMDLGTDPTMQLDDPESNFRDLVEAAKQHILSRYGYAANTIIIPYNTARVAAGHPQVKEVQIRDGQGNRSDAFMSGELVGLPPELWDLTPVVPKSTYKSSNRGQNEVRTQIWGNNIWIGFVAPTPAEDEASFSYRFFSQDPVIRQGVYSDPSGDEFVTSYQHDVEIAVSKGAGYLYQNPIAA